MSARAGSSPAPLHPRRQLVNVLGPARFNTVIGLVFLIIVLASPNGLMGLAQDAWDRLRRRGAGPGRPPPGSGAGLAEQPARGAVN